MDALLITLVHLTSKCALLAELHGARPIDVLNTLVISNILLIHASSDRPRCSTDADHCLMMWTSSVSSTLCWLLGIAVLSDLNLL